MQEVRPVRHGQVSIEYLMILAFIFATIIPGIYFLYSYSVSSADTISAAQFERIGSDILSTALQTAALGRGSWLQLDANIPEAVEDINISDSGSELVITYQTQAGTSQAVFFSDVPLSTGAGADGSIFAGKPHSGINSFRFVKGNTVVQIDDLLNGTA